MTYIVKRIRKGSKKYKALWNVRVIGSRAVGAGSRPELAIRDWQEQNRRWLKNERPYANV